MLDASLSRILTKSAQADLQLCGYHKIKTGLYHDKLVIQFDRDICLCTETITLPNKKENCNQMSSSSRKHLRTKVTPDLHVTYSKNGGNLGLVLHDKK